MQKCDKTNILKEFGSNNYENVAYFNFDYDVGLLRRMSNLDSRIILDGNKIDFIVQVNNKIIPIEVKSDKSTNHNNLKKYNEKNDNKISFRFSLNNLSKDGKIVNILLYFIEYIKKINY